MPSTSTTTTSSTSFAADYQLTANHQIFGRYFDTFERRPSMLDETHNILTIQTNYLPYRNRRAQMLAFGDTQVFGANTVNAFRFTFANTKTRANDPPGAVLQRRRPRHPEHLHLCARHDDGARRRHRF